MYETKYNTTYHFTEDASKNIFMNQLFIITDYNIN